ncbi:MAG: SocA family protein [Thaumarchaeota archaeon]|jgi:uncharacterized protein YwgA|nr:SocA family protein [Nitrososphaerota archaeon]
MEFKRLAVLSFLVAKLREKYPSKQIGKTVVQKMMYLLTRENVVDYKYSMYHYGPYSSELSSDLNLCEELGILTIKWDNEKGFDITLNENQYENKLSSEDKRKIEEIVDKYGHFNAKELSIIATALFLKTECENNEDLIKVVASLKPDYDENTIRNILKKGSVIS